MIPKSNKQLSTDVFDIRNSTFNITGRNMYAIVVCNSPQNVT